VRDLELDKIGCPGILPIRTHLCTSNSRDVVFSRVPSRTVTGYADSIGMHSGTMRLREYRFLRNSGCKWRNTVIT
jgi:hypothetical protein